MVIEQPVSNVDAVDDINFDDNDEDDDNVISLNKIKDSVLQDDQMSTSDSVSVKKDDDKRILSEVNLQEPFQPGSSPVHLLSRYMVIH